MLTRLREAFGSEGGAAFPFDDGESIILHTFPSPDKLSDIDDKVLRDLGFGYRAPYVINTCKTIAEKGPAGGGIEGPSRGRSVRRRYWNVAAWARRSRTA